MKTEIIDRLLSHVKAQCRVADTDRLYDEMLDDCYSFKSVGGIFAHMQPSRVLAEMDPTAYRCGKNDYIDSLDITEICGDEYHDEDIDRAHEEFIDALRNELQELEKERDEIDPDEPSELRRLDCAIEAKQSEIDECEDYSF